MNVSVNKPAVPIKPDLDQFKFKRADGTLRLYQRSSRAMAEYLAADTVPADSELEGYDEACKAVVAGQDLFNPEFIDEVKRRKDELVYRVLVLEDQVKPTSSAAVNSSQPSAIGKTQKKPKPAVQNPRPTEKVKRKRTNNKGKRRKEKGERRSPPTLSEPARNRLEPGRHDLIYDRIAESNLRVYIKTALTIGNRLQLYLNINKAKLTDFKSQIGSLKAFLQRLNRQVLKPLNVEFKEGKNWTKTTRAKYIRNFLQAHYDDKKSFLDCLILVKNYLFSESEDQNREHLDQADQIFQRAQEAENKMKDLTQSNDYTEFYGPVRPKFTNKVEQLRAWFVETKKRDEHTSADARTAA